MRFVQKSGNSFNPAFKQLGQYASSPGHRGLAVMQNSPFSSIVVAIAKTSTHCAYPRRGGQAELTRVAGYILRHLVVPICCMLGISGNVT